MAGRWYRWVVRTGPAALALAAAGLGLGAYRASLRRGLPEDLPTAVVRRAGVRARVVEDGEVESAEKTTVECKLEAVRFRNNGRELQANGSSMIIELIPQGALVEKGEVLCRLASSDYEELVRLQQIEYQEDLAQFRAARLDLERLELQMREYREGLRPQTDEQMLGEIRMAQADIQRQGERLRWAEQMAEIGYLSPGRLASERVTLLRLELALDQARLARENFVKFAAPAAIAQIQGQIDRARSELSFQESRVRHDAEQLALYRKQVERCTIRAPHAGMVIYARQDRNDIPIDLGTTVRKDQDLFYLPNVEKMEVHAQLHESVLSRVRRGMRATAQIEAFPGVSLEGEVVSVSPLPAPIRSRYQTDVKNYIARVRLDSVPSGLLPGMTARVEILTSWKPDALVIPPDALVAGDGRPYCYVTDGTTLRRREVELGECLPDRLEIVAGLSEGERVVTAPSRIDADLVTSPAASPGREADLGDGTAPEPPSAGAG